MYFLKKMLFVIVALPLFTSVALSQIPERRTSKSSTEFGWFAAPTPIMIEGLGQAFPVFGMLSNAYESTDIMMVDTLPGGDFKIRGIFFTQLPLLTNHLQLTGGSFYNKASFILYDRGIDSKADEYIQPLSEGSAEFSELNLYFYEERMRFFYQQIKGRNKTLQIYDKEGNLLSSEQTTSSFDAVAYGLLVDLTDDVVDPRKGVRIGQRIRPVHGGSEIQSDYEVTDNSVSGYIPMFNGDTLVLNAFTSTSKITRPGVTDEVTARGILNQGCVEGTPYYGECIAAEDKIVNDFLANNRYGTATQMGGPNRLRSYPLGRFTAGNSSSFGIEYRMNLNSEAKEINWYLLGGVRTLLQAAFFYEMGTVAEHRSDLTSNLKSSYGAGVRALISGLVYRLDLAYGDEGPGVTMFIDYPMELKPVTE